MASCRDIPTQPREQTALLSSSCPHCGNGDSSSLSNVSDNNGEIIARHCDLCKECFGFDDTDQLENLENLQRTFNEGGITTAEPCPSCGNKDINKFTIQETEEGDIYLKCVLCVGKCPAYRDAESLEDTNYLVDYEKDNSTLEIRLDSFDQLERGDHITWWSGFRFWYHAIVEDFDPESSTINIIGFWIEKLFKTIVVRRKTQKVNLEKEKIYRVEYAKCHNVEIVLNRAISRLGNGGYQVARNNSSHFVQWCKTGKHDRRVDYSYIRKLHGRFLPKSSGMKPVTNAESLKVGDHIGWHRLTGYWHHAIVTERGDNTLTVIEFAPTESKGAKGEIQPTKYHTYDEKLNIDQMYIYKYPTEEDPATVVMRALTCIGLKGYNFLLNNCEHFATWCKTGQVGSAQVQALVRSFGRAFEKSMSVWFQRLVTDIVLDVAAPKAIPICGGALIIAGIEGVRLASAAKDLHKNRKEGKDISGDICTVSQRTGCLVLSVIGFAIGELLLPVGGGLIGSFIGSLAGEALDTGLAIR